MQLQNADGLALQVVVAQDEGRDFVGHAYQQLVAIAAGEFAGQYPRVEQNLDIDFNVRSVDSRGIVDEVGIEAAAGDGILTRPRCEKPRLPPSPTTFAFRSLPLMRTASLVRSPTSALDSCVDLT